ncbi:hypothetical protein ACFY5C_10040 [Streptomyces sp. NPDC012935]|uniref:hypothetical protein n=1 Tax=Streptomyces sp. NPDC012935 TaxID=3364857 RepID=UPI0036C9C0D4
MIDTEGAGLGTEAARRLAEAGCCEIAPGLSEEEFTRIEATYAFEFSSDHRAFLAAGLPVASPPEEGATWEQPWPDWRHADPDDLRYRLEWPVREVLSDVGHGRWHPALGTRPTDDEEAVDVARAVLAQAPRLVPVYGHRFLPAGRGTWRHPVLSMWGTDIICYGHDLADYIDHEFGEVDEDAPWAPRASVPFWRDFLG